MKLNQLHDLEGAVKARKRVGRGIGSGSGKTGGRGVKGQKSRSGVAVNGFEGGQMPIYRRLPKRGFTNIFAKKYTIVSLERIQRAVDAGKLTAENVINCEYLEKAGVISSRKAGIRLLANGDLKVKLSFEVMGASKSAIAKIEKLGGAVTILTKEPAQQ